MEFTKHSGVYRLYLEQVLNSSEQEVWQFFSNPENLNKLSPQEIAFSITSDTSNSMYKGQIITYKIQLFPLVKLKWVTEITHVEEGKYFVDEQRFGPYKMWHHEHHFIPQNGTVKMIDIVWFKLPFGVFGRLAYFLFIKKKITAIFNFRAINVRDILNSIHLDSK